MTNNQQIFIAKIYDTVMEAGIKGGLNDFEISGILSIVNKDVLHCIPIIISENDSKKEYE